MATPYGIKQHTSTGYIRNWLLRLQKELGTEPWGHSTFKPAQYLSDLVWEEVGQFIKPAAECMDWLRAMAAAVNGEIGWTTPAGFPVKQNYRSTRQKQVLAVVEGERKWSTHRSAPGGLNKNKQRNGLPPNYIHSLDSAALVLTMNRCADKGVRDFSMIHDSYGCPAADTPTMYTTLREVFAEMFSGNLMLDLYHQVQQQHPTAEIPLPPSQGTLDPSVVINSQHFFAA
jgi:DNA-directed RNA polymerase